MLTVTIPYDTLRPMSKTLQNQAEFMSAKGASELVETISKYWLDRGFRGVAVTRYQHPEFPGSWFVRSNMINGIPPRGAPLC